TFECQSGDEVGNPEFIFESNDCKYNFNWRTNVVCLKNILFDNAPATSDNKSLSTGLIFVIVGIVLSIAIVLAIVLSSSSRRSYIAYKFRQVWRNAKRSPSYRYSRLPISNEESERTFLLNPEDGQVEMLQEDSDDEVLEI
uniref:Uncharacterized protein n=1 Tax=Strigamia maritima TaxID=126957 RepID=T1JC94_STRMM